MAVPNVLCLHAFAPPRVKLCENRGAEVLCGGSRYGCS